MNKFLKKGLKLKLSILIGAVLGFAINFPVKVIDMNGGYGYYWTNSIYQLGVGNLLGGGSMILFGALIGYLFYFLIWGCKKL